MFTVNTNDADNHLLKSFQDIITRSMLMVSAKRTRKSITGVQDRDILTERSHNYFIY